MSAAISPKRCSAAPLLAAIQVPTTILAAVDDPIVPLAPLRAAARSASVHLVTPNHGGHLGFIAADGTRWMDALIQAELERGLGGG